MRDKLINPSALIVAGCAPKIDTKLDRFGLKLSNGFINELIRALVARNFACLALPEQTSNVGGAQRMMKAKLEPNFSFLSA